MANVKNGAFREIIIDQCLQSRRGHSTKHIFDKVNDALENRGEEPVNSLNTIRNDILSIENRWNVVVESIRHGREIRYRYEDPDFSIFNTPLNNAEIEQLTESVSLLRRFEGMPGFEWIDELDARLQSTVNTSSKPIIGFDDNEQLVGMHYFSPIFNAINNHRTISICYKSYKDKVLEDVIHPYYLKQYNQRWFLLGLNNTYKQISIFALDRIQYIQETDVKYIPNDSISFEKYFKDIIGVSFIHGVAPETIKLLVDKEQLPYTMSKPLHKSQKMIEKLEDGSAIITIKVIPNYELTQLLLSFGEHITILSPETLRQEIFHRIEKNLKNYQ